VRVRYLSEEWLAAVDAELAARRRLPAASAVAVGLTQVVRDPAGDRTYHVSSHGGEVRAGWGPADPEDVRIVEDRATAEAIASGTRNAAEAFIRGEVRIAGDPAHLLAARDLLAALDDVMATVAARTTYGDA
jgi:putative sterol carrier protein